MTTDLDQQARTILKQNDRGGYTVPTARLYPYQWNWDSVFVALGFATFDIDRAWRELELLREGQWQNGMIPHIIFRSDDPDYFPGPSVWQSPTLEHGGSLMPSGGISQPPVLATVMRWIHERNPDASRADELFDMAYKWHRWYHDYRTPRNSHVIATVHPWETGRDNCPDWTYGLEQMTIDPDIGEFERQDIKHAKTSQRPSHEQYQKYLTIIKFGRDHGWDQRILTDQGPFLTADPGLHFILMRADRDLLALARLLDQDQQTISQIEQWIKSNEQGAQELWSPELQVFCARDVRSGEFSNCFSNASALCFYAGAGTPEQQQSTIDHLNRIADQVEFLLPSCDPEHPQFESQRYWCGPLWCQINRIVAQGLAEYGHESLAERLRGDLRRVIEQSGFYECFDPLSGNGCIGTDFSWTAAMWLEWARN